MIEIRRDLKEVEMLYFLRGLMDRLTSIFVFFVVVGPAFAVSPRVVGWFIENPFFLFFPFSFFFHFIFRTRCAGTVRSCLKCCCGVADTVRGKKDRLVIASESILRIHVRYSISRRIREPSASIRKDARDKYF